MDLKKKWWIVTAYFEYLGYQDSGCFHWQLKRKANNDNKYPLVSFSGDKVEKNFRVSKNTKVTAEELL